MDSTKLDPHVNTWCLGSSKMLFIWGLKKKNDSCGWFTTVPKNTGDSVGFFGFQSDSDFVSNERKELSCFQAKK